jgi:hypothetical protein
MPFGLANAPATFQAYMNECLSGLVDEICVVYLDDILIYSPDKAQHHKHVCQVLERLRSANLYVKLSKCEFDAQQVDFLGYVVSTDGVAMEQDRIKIVSKWLTLTTFKEVQIFLRFANFYQRFIKGYLGII